MGERWDPVRDLSKDYTKCWLRTSIAAVIVCSRRVGSSIFVWLKALFIRQIAPIWRKRCLDSPVAAERVDFCVLFAEGSNFLQLHTALQFL